MTLIEQFRNESGKSSEDPWAILLATLIAGSLEFTSRGQSTASRIATAIQKEEIQLVANFPPDEPIEPIAIRISHYKGFEDRGYAVFLVIKKEWMRKTAMERGHMANLDHLYQELELALEVTDVLKADGDHVLTKAEDEEIMRPKRLSKET